ncbi:PUA domain-containing protein [Haloarchaeobius sp. HME9146]|uniref:PUA domain-containing protein n=1 Tax=unclassified Haloarchaeobius TaxID=2614452 RepID=UPI0021C24ED0|nr:PUA domain-containing protein [Haloarchaeobius sp. HME9146]MCT9095918.1 pseudouridine synthase [Haloarchaeobius sp. HME9146]
MTHPDAFDDAPELRVLADYQFGRGAGAALFPPTADLVVKRTSSGRPEQILADAGRLVSHGTDGRFTLGIEGGRQLHEALDEPTGRVVVGDDSEPFVRDGKNVFAKFVQDADPDIRPGDEVLVVHYEGHLLAVGRAELAADAMRDFDSGMAVNVRDGAGDAEAQ